jgi:GTP-binding protein HflX
VEERVAQARNLYQVELAGAELAGLHRLYEFGEVIARKDRDDGATVATVRVSKEATGRFKRAFPRARAVSLKH